MKNSSKKLNEYAKYSGLVFQMFFIILAGVVGGIKLDEKFCGDKMIFTPILSILGVFIALYIIIKDQIKKD